jgi:HK97 family phage prohead protease
MQHKHIEFDVKSIDDEGTFTGYGSVFNNVDYGGDIVAPGAFAESLAIRASKGRKLPILWQHRAGEPIGVYDEVKEDNHGLFMRGRLLMEVQRAREAHALMKAGAVTGQSIGYSVIDEKFDKVRKVNVLNKLDLQEVSVVTFPMNDEARVETVKAAGDVQSIRDFENFLRDAVGLSVKEAKREASRIWALAKVRDEPAEDQLLKALKAALN